MRQPDPRPATPEAKVLLRIAGRDHKTFELLRDIPEAPLPSLCFHAQQAVEKWLKAVLVSHGVVVRRTHDLEELAHLLSAHGIELPLPVEELRKLNPFAVAVRYDDEVAEGIGREEVTPIVDAVRHWVDQVLV